MEDVTGAFASIKRKRRATNNAGKAWMRVLNSLSMPVLINKAFWYSSSALTVRWNEKNSFGEECHLIKSMCAYINKQKQSVHLSEDGRFRDSIMIFIFIFQMLFSFLQRVFE
jgi:hypothetical protein